jgi:pimeloyl-ACP methyl ester carboxylesterase
MIERRIDVGEVTLAVLEDGVGGSPLLLVHGFTGAKEDFAAEVERLAGLGYHVVAPDHRGHGSSDKPEDEAAYGFETFAADMVALAGKLDWQTFDLLGHSMGGMVVQYLALSHPHRVTRLILMDTHHGPVGGLDGDLIALGVEVARTQGLDIIRQILKMGQDPLTNPAYFRMLEERPGYEEWSDAKFLACSPAMYAAMLPRFHDSPDRLHTLAEVACPTLVLVGELDAPFVAASHRMAEMIPDARLVVLPDGGHCPQFEATDAWRDAVDAFLGVGAEVSAA